MDKTVGLHIFHYTAILFIAAFVLLPACKPAVYEPVTPIVIRYGASLTFQSKILNRTLHYSIYIPKNYSKDERYATVYLLHGYGGNETDWIKDGEIDHIINDLENDGLIEPMIYVMPEGDNSYYVNKYDGTSDYMRMFTDELVPLIDSHYRTKNDKNQRAVVGFSMGGYGALILASKNPGMFSVSVPLSMSFRTDEQYVQESQSVFDVQWGPYFGAKGNSGNARLTEYYKQYSPFHFFANSDASTFESVHYFIDCGDDEETLSITNNEMHSLMRSKNIAHEYRVRNGAHDWEYWRSAMLEALPFIQSCFAGTTYPKESGIFNSENFSGNIVQQTIFQINMNICLPKDYASSGFAYPTIYFYHSVESNRVTETKMMVAVLDSLQKIKPFILVEMDANDIYKQVNFQDITTFIDQTYRTRTNDYNRIGLGNKLGGKALYDASVSYPGLLYSEFLFDATLGNVIASPGSKFIYLDCTDESDNFDSMQALYSICRDEKIAHQFRVRNGRSTYNSFLLGVKAYTVSIGLLLNKI